MCEAALEENLKEGVVPVRAAALAECGSHLERGEVATTQEIGQVSGRQKEFGVGEVHRWESRASGRVEAAEPLGQVIPVRPYRLRLRQNNARAVQLLQPVQQHRAVLLLQHVLTNMYRVVGVDAKDLRVVGAVVDLAERQSVRDLGPPAFVAVWEDMSCVEQFDMGQATDGAPLPVSGDD